jgi:hypothetical protein
VETLANIGELGQSENQIRTKPSELGQYPKLDWERSENAEQYAKQVPTKGRLWVRKQRRLPAIEPLNEAPHRSLRKKHGIIQRESNNKRAFSHNQGHLRRFERAPATSACHPTPDISLHRTNRRGGPIRTLCNAAKLGVRKPHHRHRGNRGGAMYICRRLCSSGRVLSAKEPHHAWAGSVTRVLPWPSLAVAKLVAAYWPYRDQEVAGMRKNT